MAQVGSYPYNYDAATSPKGAEQFDRLGHPGKYYSVLLHTTGQLDLTGSNYGYSGIIVQTAGSTTIELSGGGTINAAHLVANTIHELSVSKLSGSSGAVIYVLKKQGI